MLRCYTILSVLIVSLGLELSQVNAGMVFSDNFNTGASTLWGNEAGNWIASGGVYYAQAPSNGPLTYSSLPFVLQDFAVDVDINKLSDGGIWLRSSNNQNGILLVTGGGYSGYTGLYWHIIQNGSLSTGLNIVNGLFTPGVSNAHLHITVSGNTYSAFVNGSTTAATTLTTSTFASGKVALYDYSNAPVETFDNVVVSAVPEPSSFVLLGAVLIGTLLGHARRRRSPSSLTAQMASLPRRSN